MIGFFTLLLHRLFGVNLLLFCGMILIVIENLNLDLERESSMTGEEISWDKSGVWKKYKKTGLGKGIGWMSIWVSWICSSQTPKS